MTDWQMPSEMRMGPVGLRVVDLDRVASFYRNVVGLVERERSAGAVVLGTETRPLLEIRSDPGSRPRPADAAGLFHVAMRVPSRAALGAVLDRITEDTTMTGASDHGVSQAIYLRDPEGNGVEVYRDRDPEEWPRENGNVVIPTDPLDVNSLRMVAEPSETVPADTDLGHVHLEVTDLDRSRTFYRDRLGLGEQYRVDGAAFLAAGSYHHHLGLNVWRGRTTASAGTGLDWFTVRVPEGAIEEIAARAGTPADDVTFADPDEIGIRVRPFD